MERKREREERKTNINRVKSEIPDCAIQIVRENRGKISITPAYGWGRG